jgi:hypothetical protein
MTTAANQAFDKQVGPGMLYDRDDGSLIDEGRLSSGNLKNIWAVIYLPFHDTAVNATSATGCNDKRIPFLYGRETPVGDTDYGNLPIGSMFLCLTQSSGSSSAAKMYLKVATGSTSASWRQFVNSASTPSHVTIASAKAVQTTPGSATQLITISGMVSTDIPIVNISSVGTVGATITKYDATTTEGVITIVFSADPKVCSLNYAVVRAIAA